MRTPLQFLKETFNAGRLMAANTYKDKKIDTLHGQVKRLQSLVKDDILSLQDRVKEYKGNKYSTYDEAVAEIDSKYKGTADWGSLQTGNIVDLRAAFIISEGIKVSKREPEADRELEWANAFLEYNDIDREMAQEFAKEAEIEGKLALKLIPEKTKDEEGNGDVRISARFISWQKKKYKVKTHPEDDTWYKKLVWDPKAEGKKPETLEEPEFVYKKFGGRISEPNKAAPKIMKCLTQIESLDKALRDWREINRIYASPLLHIKCQDKREATQAKEEMKNRNWKIKRILINTAEMAYVSLDIKGIESIEKEIITLAKMISGTAGIPLHFLGMADLMKNRATAKDLKDLIVGSTSKERQIWIGAYTELIKKAMTMYNELANKNMSKQAKLDPDKIAVDIPMISEEHWLHLEKIFLPAAVAGKISQESFQEQIPGFDIEKEQQRMAEREKEEIARIMDAGDSGLRNEKEDFEEKEENAT